MSGCGTRRGGASSAAPVEPVATPEPGDKRFLDPDWEQNQVFDFLKQSYLLTVRWAQYTVVDADVERPDTKHMARFYVDQIANALAPSNFAFTNPEVLKLTLASNGENLVEGLENLARDISAGGGQLRIRQTDSAASMSAPISPRRQARSSSRTS